MLGNPVDLAFDGSRLYVAEKANGMLLRFDGLAGGDRAAEFAVGAIAPESVALVPDYLARRP